MAIFLTILPFVFVILAGIASSCMDMNRDAKRDPHNVLFKYYSAKGYDYEAWWIGGNLQFPPENPFTADFWHFAKWVQSLSTTGAILSAVLVGYLYPSVWLVLYVFSWFVFSATFTVFYHWVWRDNITFKVFLRNAVTLRNLSIQKIK